MQKMRDMQERRSAHCTERGWGRTEHKQCHIHKEVSLGQASSVVDVTMATASSAVDGTSATASSALCT